MLMTITLVFIYNQLTVTLAQCMCFVEYLDVLFHVGYKIVGWKHGAVQATVAIRCPSELIFFA